MDPQEPAGFRSRSASPHPPHPTHTQYPDPTGGLTALDSAAPNATSFNANANATSTMQNPSLSSTGAESYAYPNAFRSADGMSQTLALTDQGFAPAQQFSQSFQASFVNQLEQSGLRTFQPEDSFANMMDANPADFGFSVFPAQTTNVTNATEFDPASLVLDTQLLQQQQQQQQSLSPSQSLGPASGNSLSPADLSRMSSPQHTSTPSQLSPHDAQVQAQMQSQYTPSHSRHASLDPATAAYMTNPSHPDWRAMVGNAAFQQHRRTPSEVSDVSSATHSPFTTQHESFDLGENNPSPLMAAQTDPTLYDNAFGIESFTLSEQHQHHQQQQHGLSPAHSPYVSPRLPPQQRGLDMVGGNVPFLSSQAGNQQYPLTNTDLYGDGQEAIMGMAPTSDMGQASQMAPPSINVEFAPPSRNSSFGPGKPPGADLDSLSPPIPRARGRSKSDPFAHSASRSRSPISTSSSLEPMASTSPRSLSPLSSTAGYRSTPSSRDTSPARGHNRRLSTSSIDNRYILDLADPARPGGVSGDSKRVQKHPATFQCHLCPKRFTRAYNLRSHLRTHTDERPFVCTVCGKAFARQHDRKRHEGLHSGEKKFVCRGDLAQGGQWGCGRRFARADALGRHFRSEAGRICIKPLLGEESEERNRARLLEQQQQQQSHQNQQQQAGLLQPTMPQPLMVSGMDGQSANTFVLPAALLAQYPALQTLQWDQIVTASDDPSDVGGRSSFDASSGNEYGFDDDESGISTGGAGGSGGGGSSSDRHSNIFVNDHGQMIGLDPGDSTFTDSECRG